MCACLVTCVLSEIQPDIGVKIATFSYMYLYLIPVEFRNDIWCQTGDANGQTNKIVIAVPYLATA